MRIVPQAYSRDSESDILNSRPCRKILILGSTGSIGKSTLELVRMFPNHFEVFGLVASRNAEALASQIREFRPRYAALADEGAARDLEKLLAGETVSSLEILGGEQVIAELAGHPQVDIVVCGIVGMAALPSVLSSIRKGKQIALANKECLVAGGRWVQEELQASPSARIIPVDSEHSALFQALQGEDYSQIEKLVLTASGGPFLDTAVSEFPKIQPADAVAHPRWSMGQKISVDSATMMNKALEVIEAHWLYDMPVNRIEVLIHPQSIVHSLVRFIDRSEIAQLSVPDMKGAIAFALNYPRGRLSAVMNQLSLADLGTLEFRRLDDTKFPAVSLAKHACTAGGLHPFLFNLSNEVAVEAFLLGRISFPDIFHFVDSALQRYVLPEVESYGELCETELYFRGLLDKELNNFGTRLCA